MSCPVCGCATETKDEREYCFQCGWYSAKFKGHAIERGTTPGVAFVLDSKPTKPAIPSRRSSFPIGGEAPAFPERRISPLRHGVLRKLWKWRFRLLVALGLLTLAYGGILSQVYIGLAESSSIIDIGNPLVWEVTPVSESALINKTSGRLLKVETKEPLSVGVEMQLIGLKWKPGRWFTREWKPYKGEADEALALLEKYFSSEGYSDIHLRILPNPSIPLTSSIKGMLREPVKK